MSNVNFTIKSDLLLLYITGMPKAQKKFFCTYCQDEISSVPCQSSAVNNSMIIFIRCAICDDIFLCLMVI